MSKVLLNLLKTGVVIIFCYYTFLLFRISYQYITFDTDIGFLRIKQDYLDIIPWKIAFYIHAFTSIFCVITGFLQFSKRIMKKYPRFHRILGYIYIVDILVFSAPSGLIISFYANGGTISIIAFILLSVLWWFFTFYAFIKAKQSDFKGHQNFMIRSYALTLSAITLRVWKVFIHSNWVLPPMDVYRLISWLGFSLNWIIAEIIIYYMSRKSRTIKDN